MSEGGGGGGGALGKRKPLPSQISNTKLLRSLYYISKSILMYQNYPLLFANKQINQNLQKKKKK